MQRKEYDKLSMKKNLSGLEAIGAVEAVKRLQKAVDKSLTEVLDGKEGGSRSLGGSVQHKIEDQSE